MEEVKPKLDEGLQETLDCLGSGAEEDARKLYEAMKVSYSSKCEDKTLWSIRARVRSMRKFR